jgi:hypothetical protein
MRTALFIRSAVSISAQQSFEPEYFLKPVRVSDNGKLFALDAPYEKYIPPVPIRRMGRILKTAISAALEALKQAGIERPDGILTGTGRGSVSDLQSFVKDLILLDEAALNPTSFIQSTYNSPNGWIALFTGCRGYNQTFVHRGCSFELAVLDAHLFARESERAVNLLVGGYDDLTDEYFQIRGKRQYWKLPPVPSLDILKHSDTPGTVAGEGANFFVLSSEPTGATCCLDGVELIYHADPIQLQEAVERLLKQCEMKVDDIHLVLAGLSGDSVRDSFYKPILQLFSGKPVGVYKPFCGEFETAGAFAVWLANFMFKNDKLPSELFLCNPVTSVKGPILVINDFIQGSASVMLLSPVTTD